MSRASIAAVVLCLGVAGVAWAQPGPSAGAATPSVPRVVRIDGRFVPANGLPPAAVEIVTLAIYAAETDATPLWEETQEVRVDAQGRYSVLLGVTTAEGLPMSVLAAGEARWLDMRFARPGEGDQARVLFTSVPYALRAASADTLGGLPPSAFLRVASPASGDTAEASDGTTTATRTSGPAVSTGTANFIGKFTNAVDLTSSVLFENSNRIGLGTTTPLDVLHSRFTNSDGTLTGLAVQNLGNTSASYSGMLFYDQFGALGQFQGFNNVTHEYRINNIATGASINFMLGSQSRLRVRPDGDVEIPGDLYKGQYVFLRSAASGSAHSIGLGEQALNNSVGIGNTAIGSQTIGGPGSGGSRNVGVGNAALYANAGTGNIAMGYSALSSSTGDYTIAIGDQAGSGKFGANNYNIYIGASVGASGPTETGTIRIGDTSNYARYFAGGIRGVTTGSANAVNVVIDSNGQLGTISSSRRYKEDIHDMAEASSGLLQLRPVTYRYKEAYADGSRPLDYGLIAEEVAEIYPDLVARQADGTIETVQYHKLSAMLLNELQKQQRHIAAQEQELTDLRTRLAALERFLATAPK